MMTSIFLTAVLRSFRPELGPNCRNESANRLLPPQDDALALVDFIEPLFGGLPKRFQLRLAFLLLFFQKTQSIANDFAGVAVPSRRNLVLDKVVGQRTQSRSG
jgi:hypothetical protein